MIHIESRNVDGLRVVHDFQTTGELLADWAGDNPAMGDNHILLVVRDGLVLYSSMGRKVEICDDTVRTDDVISWFSE